MEKLQNLDIKQLNILEDFIHGKNIFMSGPGGTGKSFLIDIIKDISTKTNKVCQLTALTGCAALLINAKTIHSWSGVGIIKNDDITHYINKIRKHKKTLNWIEVDCLVIDEVSMLSKKFFDILDSIAKKIRKNDKPFGGIQMILSGDFYQLPPVNKDKLDTDSSLFCFQSEKWNETFSNIHILTKIFRQDNKIFSKLLNNIRIGNITKSNIDILNSRMIPYEGSEIIPTKLFPKIDNVNQINKYEHDKINSNGILYRINIVKPSSEEIFENNITSFDIKQSTELIMKNNLPIEFKRGDQVICTYNISDKIVNGSRGVIIGFNEYPIVKFVDGNILEMKPIDIYDNNVPGLYYKKIPLEYAWALTIHKCQGMTLDLCIMDLGENIFEAGQMYVALSRVKSLEGLYLINFDVNKIKTLQKVKVFYSKYSDKKYDKEERKSEKKRIIKSINEYIEVNKNKRKPEKEINNELLNKLKEYRTNKAKEKNTSAFCVFSNDTLINIASDIPKDKNDLLNVKGVGKKKLEMYGEDLLNITKLF